MKLPFVARDQAVQANFDKIASALGEQTFKTALSFGAGWSNYGGGHEAATYSRIGRLVALQGLVTKAGAPVGGDVIGTLPTGFRPSGQLVFVVEATGLHGRVDVNSSGSIIWQAGGTVGTTYTSLSGITFIAA